MNTAQYHHLSIGLLFQTTDARNWYLKLSTRSISWAKIDLWSLSRLTFRSSNKKLRSIQSLTWIEHPLISPELQTAFQTFKMYQSYIKNMLTTPYTNGPIEGINNKIKVIKRIAFGYRSFYHFKFRILMIQNLTKPKRKILAD